MLAGIGELIRNRLPTDAFAARISGDRFAVLFRWRWTTAEKFAESLREA